MADDLLSEIRSEHTPSRRSVVDGILRDMDEKDRKQLLEALGDMTITASAIARVLARRGFKVNGHMVSAWRRGEVASDFR